jgi:TonB family protein
MRIPKKTLLIAALLAGAAGCARAEDVIVDLGSKEPRVARALLIVPPDYPAELRGKTPNGYVDLSFGVAKDGEVRDPQLVGSDLPGAFYEAVLDVIKQWRFQFDWYDEDCRPLAAGQQKYRLRVLFEMDTGKPRIFIEQVGKQERKPGAVTRINEVLPEYPKSAMRAGVVRGCVLVRLRIAQTGNVERVDIVRSEPPRIFDGATVWALTQWKFAVNHAGGETGPLTGEVRVDFWLPGARRPEGYGFPGGDNPGGPILNPQRP